MSIGCHVSTAGGLYRAVERAEETGCKAFQIFARNPRSWQVRPLGDEEARRFVSLREKAGLWPLVVHTAYLINLSSPDELIFSKSLSLFLTELSLAERLEADYLVTHLGSPKGRDKAFAMGRVRAALQEVRKAGMGKKKTAILFENSAHRGMTGDDLGEIGDIMRAALTEGLKTGMCFDTCHGFAAGYPINGPAAADKLARAINDAAGPHGLKLIHLNDSKGEAGSGVDRHANIGEGRIGNKALKAFLNAEGIKGIPIILETPKKDEGDDIRNLSAARRLLGQRVKAGA